VDVALTVNRARLAGPGATRGAVERWLAQVPVEALGLGPDELLYVPRLAAPVPLRGDVSGRAGAAAIADRLRALLEAAERDPMTAPRRDGACRFSSLPRYLAWLAALWLREGSAESRAAFAAATGGLSPREWRRTALLRDGAVLVAVAAALARAGIAARWIGMFDDAELALARKALADRFGLDLDQAVHPRTAPGVAVTLRRSAAAAMPRPLERTAMAGAAAWLDALEVRWRALPAEPRQMLLAMIVLARMPGLAGARDFASRLAAIAGDEAESPAAAPDPVRLPRGGAKAPPLAAAQMGTGIARSRSVRAAPVAAPAMSRGLGQPGEARDPGRGVATVSLPAPPADAFEPAADERFASAYAGLLFLLNAFVALGLYPDFAEPRGARLEPSPLWLADRIGLFWFGAAYRRDALCRWVAEQGRGGRLPGGWAVEPAWLAGFDRDSPPRIVESGGRATLWHAAGFPLADGHSARPRRLRALARRLGGVRRPLEPVRRARRYRLPGAPDARWIACLAHYLDARIRIAAGDPALGLSSLALAGKLSVRDLDLTASFRLDSHPVGLRTAGLDRDLGWQPAEGRSIGFRFE
jgi:hypothetical protein